MTHSTPSSLERRSVFVVLFAYLAVASVVPGFTSAVWQNHVLFVAALLGVTSLGLVLSRGTVAIATPEVLVTIALASLALICGLGAASGTLHLRDTQWAAATGAAHALIFIALRRAFAGAADETLRRPAIFLALAMALGLAAVTLSEFRDAIAIDHDAQLWRATGALGNPNVTGAWAGALALFLAFTVRQRGMAVLAVLAMVAVLLATRSRAAVLATSVVALLVASRAWRWRVAALIAVILALLIVIPNPVRDRWILASTELTYGRLDLWGFALAILADNPLGLGPGAYVDVVGGMAFDPERTWLVHQRHEIGLTHNALLTVAVEWGWLAGLAMVVLVVWCVRRVVGQRDQAPRSSLRRPAAAASGVLFLSAMADGVEQSALAFTAFLAVLALTLSTIPRERVWFRLPARLAGVGGAIVVVILLVVGGHRARAFAALDEARATVTLYETGAATVSDVRGAFAAALEVDDLAMRTWRDLGRFWAQHAGDLERDDPHCRAAVDHARTAFARANTLDPRASSRRGPSVAAWRLELWAFRRGLEPSPWKLVKALDHHLVRDPLDVEALWEKVRLEVRAGRDDKALVVAEHLWTLEPNHVESWRLLAGRAKASQQPSVALYRYVRAAEALLNARRLKAITSPASRTFYDRQVEATELAPLLEAAEELRRSLYF